MPLPGPDRNRRWKYTHDTQITIYLFRDRIACADRTEFVSLSQRLAPIAACSLVAAFQRGSGPQFRANRLDYTGLPDGRIGFSAVGGAFLR